MDLELAGRRVLVTGASKGIGLAVVRAFRAEGAAVVAAARRPTPELEATGATFIPVDLSITDGPAQLIEATLATGPRLDIVVNNAGGTAGIDDAEASDPFSGGDDVWTDTFALNVHAAVRVTRAALPALMRSRGAVVNISSDSARRVGQEPLAYASAKAALNAFSRGLAERVASSGVRVNVVSPSATRTDNFLAYGARLAAAMEVSLDDLLTTMPRQVGILSGTLIEPSEIARAVLLLASPTMPSAIGENWAVDAGYIKAI